MLIMASASALTSSFKEAGSSTSALDPQFITQKRISSVPATSASNMMEPSTPFLTSWGQKLWELEHC